MNSYENYVTLLNINDGAPGQPGAPGNDAQKYRIETNQEEILKFCIACRDTGYTLSTEANERPDGGDADCLRRGRIDRPCEKRGAFDGSRKGGAGVSVCHGTGQTSHAGVCRNGKIGTHRGAVSGDERRIEGGAFSDRLVALRRKERGRIFVNPFWGCCNQSATAFFIF